MLFVSLEVDAEVIVASRLGSLQNQIAPRYRPQLLDDVHQFDQMTPRTHKVRRG